MLLSYPASRPTRSLLPGRNKGSIMEYHAGYLTISPEDVARLFSAAIRSFRRWITAARRVAPPRSPRFGYYSRLYAEQSSRELATARALLAQDQIRAAGAVAGVALELHLKHVAAAHQVQADQRTSIAHLQDALRFAGLLDNRQRKQVQKFAGIRNLCVHARKQAPSREQVTRMIAGIEELRRTL